MIFDRVKAGDAHHRPLLFMPKNQPQNQQQKHTCSTSVAVGIKNCRHCNGACKKHGFDKAKRQRFICKTCKRTSFANYSLAKLPDDLGEQVIILLKEGCSIRSIARILKISAATVIRRVKKSGSLIEPPAIPVRQTFELDEVCTFIGNKKTLVWIAYAINKNTRQVATFSIGNRSNQMLSQVTGPLLNALPIKIYTDKLLQYKSLIPSDVHCTKKYGINHIERRNLTLRTHLKRLNRRTICFSRSIAMLRACLMIYFFG